MRPLFLPRPHRKKTQLALRVWPAQRRLVEGEVQSATRLRDWWVYTAWRRPQILRRFACWLLRHWRTSLRRESRDWILRKGVGSVVWWPTENQAYDMPFC